MSRIVVLAGSVRRGGNTDLLARAFAEGAAKQHEVEILSVADYPVHPCTGCNICFTSEGHRCVRDDGMQLIYDRLRQADVLVVASPVYFYGISAQLKAIVDRLHTPARNDFRIRKLGLILAGAARIPDLFDPIVLQYRMLLRFFSLEDAGMVLVPGVKDKGDVLSTDGIRQARELGERI
jgi:multimeric flavodoxin WrbA